MFSVYRLKFSSGHYYLGSSNKPQARFCQHKSSCLSKNPRNVFMGNVWKKHGEPVMEVLMNFDNEEEMLEYEQVLITKFIDEEFCLNLNSTASKPPGFKNKTHSQETRTKLSIAKKGVPRSKETKTKLSIAHKGKKHTEETKIKMSVTRKGRKIEVKNKPIQVGEVVYFSQEEAAKVLNVHKSSISKALKKNYKVKGLEVRRVENVV